MSFVRFSDTNSLPLSSNFSLDSTAASDVSSESASTFHVSCDEELKQLQEVYRLKKSSAELEAKCV